MVAAPRCGSLSPLGWVASSPFFITRKQSNWNHAASRREGRAAAWSRGSLGGRSGEVFCGLPFTPTEVSRAFSTPLALKPNTKRVKRNMERPLAFANPLTVSFRSILRAGRLFGLDRVYGRPYALNGVRDNVTSITTASTDVTNHGFALVSSSSGQWLLQAPAPGVKKEFAATSSSTLTRRFTVASGNIVVGPIGATANPTTAGSSFVSLDLNGLGQGVTLLGLSTALFGVINVAGFTTGHAPFSTTT
jgi:hypothetical protein